MNDPAGDILAAERAVFDRWLQADTVAYGRRFDDDATYFDTYAPGQIDGRTALEPHLQGISAAMRRMLSARGRLPVGRASPASRASAARRRLR